MPHFSYSIHSDLSITTAIRIKIWDRLTILQVVKLIQETQNFLMQPVRKRNPTNVYFILNQKVDEISCTGHNATYSSRQDIEYLFCKDHSCK